MGGVTGEMIASLPDWAQELLKQNSECEVELRGRVDELEDLSNYLKPKYEEAKAKISSLESNAAEVKGKVGKAIPYMAHSSNCKYKQCECGLKEALAQLGEV